MAENATIAKKRFQNLLNDAARLGLNVKYYDRKISKALPSLFRWISDNTKWKWDDAVLDFVDRVIKIFLPFHDKLDAKNRQWLDSLKKKHDDNKAEIAELKKIRDDKRKANNEMFKKELSKRQEDNRKALIQMELDKKERKSNKKEKYATDVTHTSFDLGKAKTISDDINEAFQQNKFKGENEMNKIFKENDLSWYTKGGMLESVNMPQFLIRKGAVDRFSYTSTGSASPAVLSVCAIELMLTLGSNSLNSYANAMDRLSSNFRRCNTGSIVYNPIDVDYYLFNLRSAIAFDRILRRAYGVLMKYDSLDSQKPISYFKAMGLDYDSFRDNAADLRFLINNNSVRLHSLVAGNSALLERTAWLFDNIFKDSDDAKAQNVMFVLAQVPYYDWTNDQFNNAQVASFSNSGATTGLTYNTIIYTLRTFMNAILDTPKVAYIAADFIKAFGPEQIDRFFVIIPENYVVNEIYSQEVLTEIQNSKFVEESATANYNNTGNHLDETVSFTINTNFRTYNPRGTTNYLSGGIINFYKNSISLPEYACATRFQWYGGLVQGTVSDTVNLIAYGTEVPTGMHFVMSTSGSTSLYKLDNLRYDPWDAVILTTTPGVTLAYSLAYAWSQVDYLPMMVSLTATYGNGSSTTVTPGSAFELFDYNNYCILDSRQQYDGIHSSVLLSLYYWPDVIKEQRTVQIKPITAGTSRPSKKKDKSKH